MKLNYTDKKWVNGPDFIKENSMFDCNLDGVDHINIYSKGKTELGRALSNFAHTPFEHPRYGRFASVEGYWYWLKCGDDTLRYAYGFNAKKLGKSILGGEGPDENEDFKIAIKQAMKLKISTYPQIAQMLLENNLPLTHYYVFKGFQKDAGYKWIVEAWAEYGDDLKFQQKMLSNMKV